MILSINVKIYIVFVRRPLNRYAEWLARMPNERHQAFVRLLNDTWIALLPGVNSERQMAGLSEIELDCLVADRLGPLETVYQLFVVTVQTVI